MEMSQKREMETERIYKEYIHRGKSIELIAKESKVSSATIRRRLKESGKITIKQRRKGKHSTNWKGGKVKYDGYWKILTPNHPRADSSGYVYEHVLVMEKKLGRLIIKGEIIHHIDGNRGNNEIENLFLCKDTGTHTNIHRSIEEVGLQLFRLGFIKFDKAIRSYYYEIGRLEN